MRTGAFLSWWSGFGGDFNLLPIPSPFPFVGHIRTQGTRYYLSSHESHDHQRSLDLNLLKAGQQAGNGFRSRLRQKTLAELGR
jgi:hypothetical protein